MLITCKGWNMFSILELPQTQLLQRFAFHPFRWETRKHRLLHQSFAMLVPFILAEHSASSNMPMWRHRESGECLWEALGPRQGFTASERLAWGGLPRNSAVNIFYTGSGIGMAEQDGGLIGAEEKVINSKNKMDENMVSHCHWHSSFPFVHGSK